MQDARCNKMRLKKLWFDVHWESTAVLLKLNFSTVAFYSSNMLINACIGSEGYARSVQKGARRRFYNTTFSLLFRKKAVLNLGRPAQILRLFL